MVAWVDWRSDQAGDPAQRLRTNPALPGDGPKRPTSTKLGPTEAVVVAVGSGWEVRFDRRADGTGCAALAGAGDSSSDQRECPASTVEAADRGWALVVAAHPTAAGVLVAYGFVPETAAEVVLQVDGRDVAAKLAAVEGGPTVFAADLGRANAITRAVIKDGAGRVLIDDTITGAR